MITASAPPRSDWLYCGTIQAATIVFDDEPRCIGQFDIAHEDGIPGGKEALAASAADYAETLDATTLLIKTFFLDIDQPETVRLGRLYAKEAISLFRSGIVSEFRLRRAGYVLDLRTMHVIPLRRPLQETRRHKLFGTTILFDDHAFHPTFTLTHLLVAPEAYGELGNAVRRSTHWATAAASQEDDGERLLLLWMAVETLTRVVEGETLTKKMMCVLGFPSSKYFLGLPREEKDALGAVQDYELWRRRLSELFDTLRQTRNAIAHSGFREVDLPALLTSAQRRWAKKALPMVLQRLQALALNALSIGIHTVSHMWDRYPEVVMMRRFTRIANDLTGNVIFSLKDEAEEWYGA